MKIHKNNFRLSTNKVSIIPINQCLIITLILISGCSQEEKSSIPVVTTKEITAITESSALSGGEITSDGNATITSRGICWGTNITPTIADNKSSDGAGAGSFRSNMIGLNGGTTYYVRAYANNSSGTGYGMTMSFTTLGHLPIAITSPATNVTTTNATLNGIVNANLLSTSVTFEYGAEISYGQTKIADQSPVIGNMNTTVSAPISGLTSNATYHFRVKAINELGTTYGNDLTFRNNCMSCKNVTYENGVVINQGSPAIYCGAELEIKLNTPPVTVGSLTTKVECTDL